MQKSDCCIGDKSLIHSHKGECLIGTLRVYDKSGSALYTTRSLPLSVSRDSFPEGTILPYTGDLAKIPHGWVLCDGNNGTPDLTGRFLEGTKTTTGIFKDAGLPNITGMFNTEAQFGGVTGAGSTGGAFYTVYSGRGHIASGVDPWNSDLYFDASRVSAVYGKSDTVQPPAYTVFYIMKTNKDFHYNHTNGAPTPNIYTKEEVDALLKDFNNRVSNTYLPINSSKYVRNLTTQYTLGLGYNENDKTIHGYLGGTDTPFASNSPSPEMFNDQGGYYKFPNGLIMQWGRSPQYGYEQNHFQNFPIPFPNKCLQVIVGSEIGTQNKLPISDDLWAQLYYFNEKGFYWVTQWAGNPGGNGGTMGASFFAIGY